MIPKAAKAKIRNGIIGKETINEMKMQPTEWEIIANCMSDKGLISKIHLKNSYNSIAKQYDLKI